MHTKTKVLAGLFILAVALSCFLLSEPTSLFLGNGYHLSQLRDGVWQDMYREDFSKEYQTRTFSFEPEDGQLTLRLVHRGGVFADVEFVQASACTQELPLTSAMYVDGELDLLDDLQADDLNVVIAQDKEIEVSWQVPDNCAEDVVVFLKANAYGHAGPFHFQGEGENALLYEMNSRRMTLQVDGAIDEVDGKMDPQFRQLWEPTTGHPDGDTLVYVSNDDKYLYVAIDVTMDNTDEKGEDWTAIQIGDKQFRVDDGSDQYGTCAFGLTSAVSYNHQTCEFAIPRAEISDDVVEFSLWYYGTGGVFIVEGPPLIDFYDDGGQDSYAMSMRDTTIYEVWFRDEGTGTPGTRTILASGTFVDPPRHAMDMVQLFNGYAIAYGEDESNTGMGYDLHIAFVNAPGDPVDADVTLALRGQDAGDYGVSKFIQLIPDPIDGVFALYFSGDLTPGFETGSVFLDHISYAGTVNTLATFPGWYTADMITDGLGGVYVLFGIGPSGIGEPNTHGTVRHYTMAGQDLGFGDVVVSSNSSSTKSGAVMIPTDVSGGDILVFWMDDELGEEGIYGQKISAAGSILWDARGEQLLDTVAEGSGFFPDLHLRASSGFEFDDVYIAYMDLNDEWRVFSVDDSGPTRPWACVQNFGYMDDYAVALVHEQGISGGPRGVYVVGHNFEEILTQLYDQSSGESVWDGHQVIVDDTNVSIALQNQFYPSADGTIRVDAKGIEEDGSNGMNVAYISGVPSFQYANINRGTYAAGPGGDCVLPPMPPDAIINLAAVAGDTEVGLSWTAPNDNGDAIIDYIIEYGETAGFPGNAAVFVDGVNTLTDVTVTALTNGTEYSFRVFAENGNGIGGASNVASVTPGAPGGSRRRDILEMQGPQIFLGRLQEFLEALQSSFSGTGDTHGSAEGDSSQGVVYQTEDGGASQRSFAEDEFLRSQIQPEKENLLRLLDLIIQLRQLFAWMSPEEAQLLKSQAFLQRSFEHLFLTRYFHQMTGIEYLKRGDQKVYEFDYRDPIHQPTRIVADYQKSILLSFGKACYGEEVLRYSEAIDFPGNTEWFKRYVFVMKPWMDVVLGRNDYVQWASTGEIDVLESLYLFLFGYCLADQVRD